ncbi:MAG: hypothetical protein AAF413_04790 [Patescibacteria group bacterium]
MANNGPIRADRMTGNADLMNSWQPYEPVKRLWSGLRPEVPAFTLSHTVSAELDGGKVSSAELESKIPEKLRMGGEVIGLSLDYLGSVSGLGRTALFDEGSDAFRLNLPIHPRVFTNLARTVFGLADVRDLDTSSQADIQDQLLEQMRAHVKVNDPSYEEFIRRRQLPDTVASANELVASVAKLVTDLLASDRVTGRVIEALIETHGIASPEDMGSMSGVVMRQLKSRGAIVLGPGSPSRGMSVWHRPIEISDEEVLLIKQAVTKSAAKKAGIYMPKGQ